MVLRIVLCKEYCYSTLLSLMIGFHDFGADIFQPKLTGMIMLFMRYRHSARPV